MSASHVLKCWPEFFSEIWRGHKSFEIRRNDRNFHEGDFLRIQEWSPETALYSGRVIEARCGYMLREHDGLGVGFVIIQLEAIKREEA